jgi:TetR/AcrR family transcriptional regulator
MTETAAKDWGGPATAQEDGRTRILAAAIEVFSGSGFDGSSLRQIGDRAGVQHQLVVYHFKTKDALWRAAITTFFARIGAREAAWTEIRDEQGPAAALRQLVREFVHFTAERPQYHRIATFEGRTDSERLRWLLDQYVRPFYALSSELIAAAQDADEARSGDPGQLHYGMIGLVTTSFVFSREYTVMTGLDPFAKDQVEAVVQLTWDFLGIAER